MANHQEKNIAKRLTTLEKELEEKNRELEIEAAVERVRAKALAMHKSEEILSVVITLHKELSSLNIPGIGAATICLKQDDGRVRMWDITSANETRGSINFTTDISFKIKETDPKLWIRRIWDSKKKYAVIVQDAKDHLQTFKWVEKYNKEEARNARKFIKANKLTHSWHPTVPLSHGKLNLDLMQPPTAEIESILIKMGAAFDLAYKRFLDLKNAEAQAREAQIEAALEKIRSRSLAMHKSEELKEVVAVLFQKFQELEFGIDKGAAIVITYSPGSKDHTQWITDASQTYAIPFFIPFTKHSISVDQYKERKKRSDFYSKTYRPKETKEYFSYLFQHTAYKQVPKSVRQMILNSKSYGISIAFEKNSAIAIPSTIGKLVSGNEIEILKRFSRVFEQSYTRFLDLQKAEAQAREAQIEAALERVRARTMGMHSSNELSIVIKEVTDQVKLLGFDFDTSNIGSQYDEKGFYLWNSVPGEDVLAGVYVPKAKVKIIDWFYGNKSSVNQVRSIVFNKKDTYAFFKYYLSLESTKHIPADRKRFLIAVSGISLLTEYRKDFTLSILNYRGVKYSEEESKILTRFANAFEQTYTRFLDLQKAEAQTREAQIETGLERVRSKTMAMHKSAEVTGVAVSLNEELLKLGFDGGSTIIIMNNDTGDTEQWTGFSEDKTLRSCLVPYFKHPFHDALFNSWRKGEKFLVYTVAGKEKKSLDAHYFSTGYKIFPESDKKWMKQMRSVTFSHAFMKYGAIHWGPGHLTEEQLRILERFSKVFEQSYTRFLDLQKAEAQTREAQIEAALERIRSRSMAMHQSNELAEVASVVFEQLNKLGISIIRTWINIFNAELKCSEVWITSLFKANAYPIRVILPLDKNEFIISLFQQWKNGAEYLSYSFIGKEAVEYNKALRELTGDSTLIPDNILTEFPSYYLYEGCHKYGTVGVSFFEPVSKENGEIIRRFAKVFEQTYTRFLDLQKAEAQAREAQIEAGLERVRSRAMAMQSSEELSALIGTVFTELTKLDLVLTRSIIWVFEPATNAARWWMANGEEPSNPLSFFIKYHEHPAYLTFVNEWKRQNVKFIYDLKGQDKKNWDDILFNETDLKFLPAVVKNGMKAPERVLLSASFNNFGGINVASLEPLSDEHFDILLRFAKVFDLTYTRFNDLKQAEAQAREAEIELALERVRARAMAMQKPAEFVEVINVIGEQFLHLGFDIEWVNFGANGLDIASGIDTWNFAVIPGGDPVSSRLFIARFDHPVFIDATRQLANYKKTGNDLFVMSYGKKIKDRWLDHLFTKTIFKDVPEEYRAIQYAKPGYTTSNLALKDTFLSIGKFDTGSFTDEQHAILRRIGKAFGQAYTRFLDLQKAEAQAREAQIEAALERVRSRTMAMHQSKEIADIVGKIFAELKQLDLVLNRVLIWIFNNEEKYISWWSANPEIETNAESYRIDYNDQPVFLSYLNAWQKRVPLHLYTLSGDNKKNWEDHLFSNTELSKLPAVVRNGMREEGTIFTTSTISDYGLMMVGSFEPLSNENIDIIQRFGRVFQQSYTRYLDVQKAEAQAREAKIEAALEKVRARTMGMQRSEELAEVATVLFQQVKALGIQQWVCGFSIFEIDDKEFTWYPGSPDGNILKPCKIPLTEHPVFISFNDSRKRGDELFVYEKEGKFQEGHYRYMMSLPGMKELLQEMLNSGLSIPTFQIDHIANFSHGNLVFITYEHFPEMHDVFKRFAKVFDGTYTRFLDLKKAEEQARESQIQLALERVRARTMAMQKSDELPETSLLLFQQMKEFGETVVQNSIGIIKEEQGFVELSTTVHGHHEPKTLNVPINDPHVMAKAVAAWKAKRKSLTLEFKGQELKDYNELRNSFLETKVNFPEDNWVVNIVFFSKGWLSFSSNHEISKGSFQLLERFAGVFDLTYTRFLDLKQAEEQARESQIQLALERVRARTMAMQHSDELSETSFVLFQQFNELGKGGDQISIGIFEEDEKAMKLYSTFQGSQWNRPARIKFNKHRVYQNIYSAWKDQKRSVVTELTGKELQDLNKIKIDNPDYQVSENELAKDHWSVCTAFFSNGILSYASHESPAKESIELLERFASVFDLTYRRFLDLQKAEAQARESQIQLALERVRARTMAMQKSDELQETAYILFQQFKELGEEPVQITIGIFNEQERKIEFSITGLDDSGSKIDQSYKMDIDEPILMSGIYKAWREQKTSTVFELSGKKLADWITYRNKLGGLPQSATPVNYQESRSVCAGYFSKGFISFSRSGSIETETARILERFAGVFDLTYTRFLDLKKAEAQAREAKIEAALERIRSRAMAMQNSADLNALIRHVFDECTKLDLVLDRAIIMIVDPKTLNTTWVLSNPETPEEPTNHLVKYHEYTPYLIYLDSWKKRFEKWEYILEGEEKKKWDRFLFCETDLSKLPVPAKEAMQAFNSVRLNYSFADFGSIALASFEPLTESQFDILCRFTKVFDLTYTRFNDLKQAESQAKEAQIELALERVRARTMAMHRSEELAETAQVLFHQLNELNVVPDRIAIGIADEINNVVNFWSTDQAGSHISNSFKGRLDERTVMSKGFKAWKDHQRSLVVDLQGDDLKEWIQFAKEEMNIPVKEDFIKGRRVHNFAFFSHGWILVTTHEPQSTETIQTLERFASVFSLTYRRFLDLEKAEAQVREAQIEAALEKVRSRSLAMHKSDELQEVVNNVYERLQELNVVMDSCNIAIFKEGTGDFEFWIASPHQKKTASFRIFADWNYTVIQHLLAARKSGKDFFSKCFSFEEKNRWFEFAFKETDFGRLPTERQKYIFEQNAYALSIAFAKHTGVQINTYSGKLPTENEKEILIRFSKVFEQAYIRFLDLQKAEAQAREAQIEAGLERVRARTMAMHSSDDVSIATATMFTELEKLGIQNLRGGITIVRPDQTQEVWSVTNLPDGRVIRAIGVFDMRLHPLWRALYEGKQRNDDYQYYWMAGQDKQDYINILNSTPNYLVQPIKDFPDIHVQSYFFGDGAVWTNSLQPHSEEDKQIMKRFASVFGQTYRRYLDLQKAEASARESQIEAALEKVRASTMAMQKSEDLSEAAFVLFKQFKELGESPERIFIATFDNAEETVVDLWGTNQGGNQLNKLFRVSADEPTVIKKIVDAWKEKKNSIVIDLTGDDLKNYLQFLENTGIPVTPGVMTERRVQTVACFSKGVIGVTTPEPRPAISIQLLERFANVFDLTYTRFLDLLQAEAQAREATIEAALEKVRGKAMAMHNSNDLSATASMIFTELRKLGITPIRCGVGLLNKESRKAQLYSAGDNLAMIGWVQLTDHPVLEKIYDTWLNNEEYYPDLEGEQMHLYYEQLLKGLPVTPPDTINSQKQYGHFIPFSIGCLYAWADKHYDDADIRILKRFASIIDLTFRRYIELQKSEANAREAVKQAALDRVRADIASMRTVEDLDRITPLIWNELTILNIPFIRCGVFIMDEAQELIHTFLSTPDGKAIAAFHLPYETPGNIQNVLNSWRNKKKYVDHWNEEEFHQFAQILVEQGALDSAENYLKTIPHGGFYLHFLPFLQGMLYVGNTSQLNDEMVALVQAVADAFSTAYARYEDFNKLEAAKQQVENTLTDLKQAQTQLVQSEKMASLGELTAGIAHEIQNPLNFVNNFSDVSNELLEEMKNELEKGNKEDAIAIVEDVRQNLEKILHHGKRADAIVKGMLQHSRIGSGQKEMTDINSLADEYLRLAYHGLRAKDKTFNAKFETHFDNNIGKINIVAQDIGRVLLNLINNAFYTVTEKKKMDPNDYEPAVTVTTLKENGRIEIKVKDNGNGIPQKILDKIFQPFFTTKPTGQGTGLGLSLAYDIITKGHGGELKVETKEREGSEFIILLPLN